MYIDVRVCCVVNWIKKNKKKLLYIGGYVRGWAGVHG